MYEKFRSPCKNSPRVPSQLEFFRRGKIECSDFFTVCQQCIEHAFCKISDFSNKPEAQKQSSKYPVQYKFFMSKIRFFPIFDRFCSFQRKTKKMKKFQLFNDVFETFIMIDLLTVKLSLSFNLKLLQRKSRLTQKSLIFFTNYRTYCSEQVCKISSWAILA